MMLHAKYERRFLKFFLLIAMANTVLHGIEIFDVL